MAAVTVRNNDVEVELAHIGEGYEGDYDPDDPTDKPLLRFTVSRLADGEWEQVDDASYCTSIVDDLGNDEMLRVAWWIWNQVEGDVNAGVSIKRKCEDLSWLGSSDEWDVLNVIANGSPWCVLIEDANINATSLPTVVGPFDDRVQALIFIDEAGTAANATYTPLKMTRPFETPDGE